MDTETETDTPKIAPEAKNGFRVEREHWPNKRRLELWLRFYTQGEVIGSRCVWRSETDDVAALGEQAVMLLVWNGVVAALNAGKTVDEILSAMQGIDLDDLPRVEAPEGYTLVHAEERGWRCYVWVDLSADVAYYVVEDGVTHTLPLGTIVGHKINENEQILSGDFGWPNMASLSQAAG